MAPITLNVPTETGVLALSASPEKPLLILGRNGTGKSTLIHKFASQFTGAIYLPGARPSYFGDENSSVNPASRKQLAQNLQVWDRNPDTRWKQPGGSSRNEKAIYDLTNAELQFNYEAANDIKREQNESAAIARLKSGSSPLDRVNAILRQSNLPIKVAIEAAELKALREEKTFSIARASDGERIALVLISEVVAAPVGSIFFIDEPELHLHRGIVVPLITSIIRENPGSTFIVGTHELELVSACPNASLAVIRNCSWPSPNNCRWELDQIADVKTIPEDLRVDILGSRRKILFVEGTSTSLDSPLYALLFPNVSIRSRDNCREVERAVAGLSATRDLHHSDAWGMVDGDGMSPEQIASFEAKNVYPLPVYSVESLYYSDEVLNAIAARQAETLGMDKNNLLNEAKAAAIAALSSEQSVQHLASRVAERQLLEMVLQQVPRREDLTAGNSSVSMDVPSTFPEEITRLKSLRDSNNIAGIISRYPVRESCLLNTLATGLRFPNRSHYEMAVLRQLSVDDELCESLRQKLGTLALRLG